MSREILVTGAHGALGTALQEYAQRGSQIIYAPRHHEVDVTDLDVCRDFLQSRPVDVIIHTAAITNWELAHRDPERAFYTNCLGIINMAKLALDYNARLVIVSTDGVFSGQMKHGGYTEQDKPDNPTSMYGWTKLAGELSPKMIGMPKEAYLIVRLGWLFGPTPQKDVKFVGAILRKIAHGETVLNAINDKVGTLAYTAHIAEKIFHYVGHSTFGVRHLANTGEVSRYDVAREIVELWEAQGVTVVPVTSDAFPSPVRRPDYAVLTTLYEDAGMPSWKSALGEYHDRFSDVHAFE